MSSPGAVLLHGALVGSLCLTSALAAQERTPYPATLDFGTGLVTIPVAWISPNSGELWVTSSGKTIDYTEGLTFATRWNTNISLETHWLGRFAVGASAYSQNPEYGFFGQLLLLRDNGMLPAVAVGVRNIGSFKHEDRLLVGHDLAFRAADSSYQDVTSSFAQQFKTSPTLYGVVTKEIGNGSFTVGYGNGLFSDDGDLGDIYNDKGTIASGLFLGGRYAFRPTTNTSLTLLGENDGWDWNAGVVGNWRGLYLGVYGTELEEGGRCSDPATSSKGPLCRLYNYAKVNATLGYNGNLFDIARGQILRSRVTELEREQNRLRAEIGVREERIASLEVSLRKAQAGELAEIAKRRESLEAEIQQERDAIQRAEERLKQLQQKPPVTPPPPPPPSGTTPPLH